MVEVTLGGNADAVEFCPNAGATELLAAATYTLQDEQRVGSINLFQVIEGDELNLLDCISDISGVFDIRWRPAKQGQDPLLAQALSNGCLQIHSLQDYAKWIASASVEVTSSMCLSLDWDPFGSCKQHQLAISHSDGHVSLASVSDDEGLTIEQTWKGHGFEVWTASYDAWKPGLIYTGADDSNFCGWDLRSGVESPVFRDLKSHEMGVCCVQSSHLSENVVATGSYDENLRLWDVRMMVRPVAKQMLGLGGGVWKVKWHPLKIGLIVAACMHNGFGIVQVEDGSGKATIVQEYKGHQSLAYGVDWSRDSRDLIASCSFYDSSLHLWKFGT